METPEQVAQELCHRIEKEWSRFAKTGKHPKKLAVYIADALRAVDVDVLECDGTCGRCAGSGEGYVDGSRCSACGGSGVPRDRDEDDRREAELEDLADARRDDRMTEDDHE